MKITRKSLDWAVAHVDIHPFQWSHEHGGTPVAILKEHAHGTNNPDLEPLILDIITLLEPCQHHGFIKFKAEELLKAWRSRL